MALFKRRKAAPTRNRGGGSGIDRLDHSDIDIWAMRASGYVDPEGLQILRDRLGVTEPLKIDYEIEPDEHQKQRVIEQYEEMAAYLNDEGHDGRRDWTPRQAWSLDRAATAELWGRDPEETILPIPWRTTTSAEHDAGTSQSEQQSQATIGSTAGCVDLGWGPRMTLASCWVANWSRRLNCGALTCASSRAWALSCASGSDCRTKHRT
jgi:hypothetical protein